MTDESSKSSLERLAERFNVELHRRNGKGFTYIPIEHVIRRFNEVTPGWDLKITKSEFSLLPGLTYGRASKPAAYALVEVEITADTEDAGIITRSGIGGDFGSADDVDKLVKTALAEAIKKAGNEFGVGLYLWDEEERALIESAQEQGLTGQVERASTPVQTAGYNDALDALKNRVADLAERQGINRTGPAIAAHFGIEVAQLQDAATLEKILADNTEAEEPAAVAI
jgi:hypothetical protein